MQSYLYRSSSATRSVTYQLLNALISVFVGANAMQSQSSHSLSLAIKDLEFILIASGDNDIIHFQHHAT